MTNQELLNLALKGLSAATEIADLYTRAAAAANQGDRSGAEAYLDQARTRFAAARGDWDAAGDG